MLNVCNINFAFKMFLLSIWRDRHRNKGANIFNGHGLGAMKFLSLDFCENYFSALWKKNCRWAIPESVGLDIHYGDNLGNGWQWLGQNGSSGAGKKWTDLGYVLQVVSKMCSMIDTGKNRRRGGLKHKLRLLGWAAGHTAVHLRTC